MTSFILTSEEWQYLQTRHGDGLSLVVKGFAVLDKDGSVVLGPELSLVMEELADADCEGLEQGVIAVRGKRFCMLIEPYRHITGAIRILPCQNNAELAEAIRERRNHNDTAVD